MVTTEVLPAAIDRITSPASMATSAGTEGHAQIDHGDYYDEPGSFNTEVTFEHFLVK